MKTSTILIVLGVIVAIALMMNRPEKTTVNERTAK